MPRIPAKLLLLGGAAAAAAGALFKRDRVAGALRSRTGAPEPPASDDRGREHDLHPTSPSNYDAPGPPANTATPVPVPEPFEPPAVDEDAEADAAAAEARAIGGSAPEYQDRDDPTMSADPADRPLMESGEGWEEGEEIAEQDLVDAASPHDTKSDYERTIEETIEAQDDPHRGELGESLDTGAAYAETGNPEADSAGLAPPPPRQEPGPDPSAPPERAPADPADADDDGDDWQTWSGQAVKP
jgi:hypothetical protein